MFLDLKIEKKQISKWFIFYRKERKKYLPIIEHLIGILVFHKVNNTFQPIHFSFHQFVHNLKEEISEWIKMMYLPTFFFKYI